MGYSCTAAAAYASDVIMEILHETSTPETARTSNSWSVGDETYFFECGRERPDGAITGTVYRNLPDGQHCRKAGTVRIEPDGIITRYPTTTRAQRLRAQQIATQRFLDRFVQV